MDIFQHKEMDQGHVTRRRVLSRYATDMINDRFRLLLCFGQPFFFDENKQQGDTEERGEKVVIVARKKMTDTNH